MEPTEAILHAATFAAEKHRDQRRKNITKAPYINHPLGVAFILSHEAKIYDTTILQGAILHDTVEDTGTSLDEIELEFGKEVRLVVSEVSDDKSLSADKRKRAQIEHAPHISYGGKLVKLADKLYNLRDLMNCPPAWTVSRIQGYFVWAKKVVGTIKGTNKTLDEEFEKVWKSTFVLDGKTYPTIPTDVNLDDFLEKYYEEMRK
eukprot:TRINITY_DN2775_c0_g1_i1.p1 TRINITY_DN2775_c0_g1~~TRINITY_DN2775_c0_g1_i1.p1  ORF type:complete len:204 (-),score=62.97 TRINITY_DN2775_c0_g1_i1:38-649(-)